MGTVPGTPCQATPSPTPSPSPTPTPCVVCDPPAHQPVSLGIWPTPLPWTVDVSDIDSIQDDTIRDRFQAAAAASVHLVNVAAEVPIVQLSSDTGQLRLVAHTACEAEDTGFPAFRADGEIADHTYREPEAGSPLCPGPYLDHGAVLYFREKKTAGNPFCHWADQVADMWTQTETTNLVMHELLHAVITVGHPPDHGAAELCTPVQSRMCSRAKAIAPPVLFPVDFAALECLYQGYVP